jgi:hypothetical protein
VITFLGTIIFTTIVGIGSLDSRSGLSLFGKYVVVELAGPRPGAPRTRRRFGDGPPAGR